MKATLGKEVEGHGGHSGHGRCTRRNLQHSRAKADPRGLRRKPAERGRSITAVSLSGPGGGEIQPLCFLSEPAHVLDTEGSAWRAQCDPETHSDQLLPAVVTLRRASNRTGK